MKIAIMGYGIEGQSSYNYFRSQPDVHEIVIYDEDESLKTPTGVKTVLGTNAFSQIPDDFTIIRSPSIRPDRIKTNGKIWSSTNEFFKKCPAPIIGVTGTKGKGSTASFVSEILKSAGQKTHLVGNIGVPALDDLPNIKPSDIVIYELSSFQLWDIRKSPHVTVMTIIESDHLDVHSDIDEYVNAKSNIVKYQTADDFVVYNTTDDIVTKIAESSEAVKLPYPNTDLENLARDSVQIVGEHQIRNAEAAILAAKAVYPNVTDRQIADGLSNFTGLPHRLQFVCEIGGVKYYDDSIATTPSSAIASIKSFKDPKILLLGGKDKGADYSELAAEIIKNNVKQVIVYGSNRVKIMKALIAANYHNIIEVNSKSMLNIVRSVAHHASPGDIVILSPAAASFDMFKSYADRGEQFVAAINKLD